MQPGKKNNTEYCGIGALRPHRVLHAVAPGGRRAPSLVIDKRGTRHGIRNYVRLAGPGTEVLRFIAEESKRKGTDKLTSRDIDQEIKAPRAAKRKRG